jgi:hypothetical protein
VHQSKFRGRCLTWVIFVRSTRSQRSRHVRFAPIKVGNAIYAVSGANNAGGAGTLSVVPVNEIYEP